jgi:hypothetical protein
MRVNGVEIPQEVVDRCVTAMKSIGLFTSGQIEVISQHVESYRLVDRLLQRERKAGNIEYSKGEWRWIGPR